MAFQDLTDSSKTRLAVCDCRDSNLGAMHSPEVTTGRLSNPGTPDDYTPQFRNVKPMTRPERLALRDKAMREKELLIKRPGHLAKIYRENVPETSAGLTSLQPGAAGYISDADRFHSDTSGEEFQRRKARYIRHMSIIEGKRLAAKDREERRWQQDAEGKVAQEDQWAKDREKGLKARRNQSLVPYNPITLLYNNGLDGDRLRFEDDRTRHRAALRSQNLQKHGGSRYNIISGEASAEIVPPPAPVPTPALSNFLHAKSNEGKHQW